jgi:hypothetical protein
MQKLTQLFFKCLFFLILTVITNRVTAQKKSRPVATVAKEQTATQKTEIISSVLQKIDPQLLSNSQQDRQEDSDMEKVKPTYRIVNVEIKCTVTEALLKLISNNRGSILSSSVENNSIVAKVPLFALEKIAAIKDVIYIRQLATISKTSNTTPLTDNK